jgi:hypothetical protein
MLLILAAVLAIAWIVAFAILHVTGVAIHVLAILAATSLLIHFIRPRSYRAPASAPPPADAIK